MRIQKRFLLLCINIQRPIKYKLIKKILANPNGMFTNFVFTDIECHNQLNWSKLKFKDNKMCEKIK